MHSLPGARRGRGGTVAKNCRPQRLTSTSALGPGLRPLDAARTVSAAGKGAVLRTTGLLPTRAATTEATASAPRLRRRLRFPLAKALPLMALILIDHHEPQVEADPMEAIEIHRNPMAHRG